MQNNSKKLDIPNKKPGLIHRVVNLPVDNLWIRTDITHKRLWIRTDITHTAQRILHTKRVSNAATGAASQNRNNRARVLT